MSELDRNETGTSGTRGRWLALLSVAVLLALIFVASFYSSGRRLVLANVAQRRAASSVDGLARRASRTGALEASLRTACALRESGEMADAERLLRALSREGTTRDRAELELARLYLSEVDAGFYCPERALEHAERASERGARCYELLARAYLANGEKEMAAVTLEVAFEDDALTPQQQERCRSLLDSVVPPCEDD